MAKDDFTAGASAARNKIAAHFDANGIRVFRSRGPAPPTDEDFLRAAQRASPPRPAIPSSAPRADVVSVICARVRTHTTTVRYTANLDGVSFQPYVPKSILPVGRASLIGLALSPDPGALPESQGALSGGALVRYDFVEVKKHSLIYEWSQPGERSERLYVPKEFFGARTRHPTLFVRIYA